MACLHLIVFQFIPGVRAHARPLSDLVQRRALVHGDVVGLVALDFVLRIVRAAVARMSLVFGVAGMDLDDAAADMARFRIPSDVVA